MLLRSILRDCMWRVCTVPSVSRSDKAVTKIFVGPAAGVEAGETLMTIDVTGANGTKAGENGATGAAVDGTATDGTMEGGK